MQYKQGSIGRIFLVKFEHGDDLLEKIKELASEEGVSLATVTFLGALGTGDIVTGPRELSLPAVPTWVSFSDGREVLGFGIITTEEGRVQAHIHSTFGKGEKALTGCMRKNCGVFVTVEAVITEILGVKTSRRRDNEAGCDLLKFDPSPA
jgi:predicted DNA-binding protein with PD1-like motif